MHPVIRILCFLTLITALARASFPFILLADAFFLLFALRSSQNIFGFTWRLMRRMRWFWLSIVLLYTLMTPGGGQSVVLGTIELSLGGLWLGLERCLALATVLLFFSLLIHTTPPIQLQGALYWLLRPLRHLGLPADRLSVRVALTLQKIHELQSNWLSDSDHERKLKSWRDIPEHIAALIHDVFVRAEAKPLQIELSLETSAPGNGQWIMFMVIIALIVAARLFTTHFL